MSILVQKIHRLSVPIYFLNNNFKVPSKYSQTDIIMYLFFNFPFTYKQNGKLVAKQELLIHSNGCFPEHVHVEIKNAELQIFHFSFNFEFHSTPCLKSEEFKIAMWQFRII